MRPLILLSLVLLSLPACSLLDSGGGEVSVEARGDALLLENATSERIYYHAMGREASARANWALHLDAAYSVAPGGRATIRYEDLFREEGETEAVVYWWHAEPVERASRPGPIHHLVVAL